jgi:hypothetical protein
LVGFCAEPAMILCGASGNRPVVKIRIGSCERARESRPIIFGNSESLRGYVRRTWGNQTNRGYVRENVGELSVRSALPTKVHLHSVIPAQAGIQFTRLAEKWDDGQRGQPGPGFPPARE